MRAVLRERVAGRARAPEAALHVHAAEGTLVATFVALVDI